MQYEHETYIRVKNITECRSLGKCGEIQQNSERNPRWADVKNSWRKLTQSSAVRAPRSFTFRQWACCWQRHTLETHWHVYSLTLRFKRLVRLLCETHKKSAHFYLACTLCVCRRVNAAGVTFKRTQRWRSAADKHGHVEKLAREIVTIEIIRRRLPKDAILPRRLPVLQRAFATVKSEQSQVGRQ